jgi:hypothetical protein
LIASLASIAFRSSLDNLDNEALLLRGTSCTWGR